MAVYKQSRTGTIPKSTRYTSGSNQPTMYPHFYLDREQQRLEMVRSQQRLNSVLNIVEMSHMSYEERDSIEGICATYTDLFYLEGDYLTYTSYMECSIQIAQKFGSIYVKPFNLSRTQNNILNNLVCDLLEKDIIEASDSSWNSPVMLGNENGHKQVKVNYTVLNARTVIDPFPIPIVSDVLELLGNNKYFSTLDLASCSFQVKLSNADKCKTAFSTQVGRFQFKRMPFGLRNGPAMVQRIVSGALTGINCGIYFDDIVVYGKTLSEHNKNLIAVLEALQKNNLKIQTKKCNFLKPRTIFLGHEISSEGFQPKNAKILEMLNILENAPKSRSELKFLLGKTASYKKFINNYAEIVQPMNRLLKGNYYYDWDDDCNYALENLYDAVHNMPILSFPDFDKRFIVRAFSSEVSISGKLFQLGKGPIAFASRSLCESEEVLSQMLLSILSIVWNIQHFRYYLFGRKFTIYTGEIHSACIFSCEDDNRIQRWRAALAEYDFDIIYIGPGGRKTHGLHLKNFLGK